MGDTITTTQQLHDSLAYWRGELELNERYHRQLKLGPLAGLPLAAVAAFFSLPAAGLVLATAALIFVTGMYMTVVRRFEFRAHMREVEAALASPRLPDEAPLAVASTPTAAFTAGGAPGQVERVTP